MEDYLIFWGMGEMEDDLNLKVNGRQPQFLSIWKTTPGKAGLASLSLAQLSPSLFLFIIFIFNPSSLAAIRMANTIVHLFKY
jgi:hypothetical protein